MGWEKENEQIYTNYHQKMVLEEEEANSHASQTGSNLGLYPPFEAYLGISCWCGQFKEVLNSWYGTLGLTREVQGLQLPWKQKPSFLNKNEKVSAAILENAHEISQFSIMIQIEVIAEEDMEGRTQV